MKIAACSLLVCSVVLCGCFTGSYVAGDAPAPDDSKVIFYLKDGTHIQSYADRHSRVEGGYQVSGLRVARGKHPEQFTGILLDRDIDRCGVDEFNVLGTLLGVGLLSFALVFVGVTMSQ